jgi:NIMA-interacting peptidyl-prolyl cis-trans isomerase 1
LRGRGARCSLAGLMNRSLALALALAVLAPLASSCATLATSPDWVGGDMAVSVPIMEAAAEAKEDRERRLADSLPKQIGAKHLLVMYNESISKPPEVHRTRAEARKRAQEALLKVRAGAPFEEVVKEYTDEPGGLERGGDLGIFDKKSMVAPFANAAFRLKVGEVSEVVETTYGFHVIKRVE